MDLGTLKTKFYYFFFIKQSQTYSFSWLLNLACPLVTLMLNCCALSTMSFLFLADTPCAISAQYLRFCIIRTSSSYNTKLMLQLKVQMRESSMYQNTFKVSIDFATYNIQAQITIKHHFFKFGCNDQSFEQGLP